MERDRLGGVPYQITKEGSKLKIRFYPKGENPRDLNSVVFTMLLEKSDKEKLKKIIDSL